MDSLNNSSKFGGDAWLELQAFKTRQINRRERLNRHRDLINGITIDSQASNNANSPQNSSSKPTIDTADNKSDKDLSLKSLSVAKSINISTEPRSEIDNSCIQYQWPTNHHKIDNIAISVEANNKNTLSNNNYKDSLVDTDIVECLLLLKLCDVALRLPIDSKSLQRSICKVKGLEDTQKSTIENLLEKFAHQELITIEQPSSAESDHRSCQVITNIGDQDEESSTYVVSADHTKLVEFDRTFGSCDNIRALLIETRNDDLDIVDLDPVAVAKQPVPIQTIKTSSTTSSQKINDKEDGSRFTTAPSNRELVFHHEHATKSTNNDRAKSSPRKKDNLTSEDVESLLSLSSTKERESKKLGEELLELLSKPTAKERNLLERFRSADGYQVQEFCPKGTKDECRRNSKGTQACDKLHFKKIIAKHTEESLGDCSFLNTCFHMDSCKYVHYEVDCDDKQQILDKYNSQEKPHLLNFERSTKTNIIKDDALSSVKKVSNALENNQAKELQISCDNNFKLIQSMTDIATNFTLNPEEQARIDTRNRKRFKTVLYPPQWIQCDLRYFDMSLLGKFSVVMADPPWDIHMELPYGTMSDDEMRKLNIPALQDEGVIFLWVTGRAMELGRECLSLWGYERCDEIIWVKTNQLQRIIRTGRTGHWLNHGKEHCLVGVKGAPTDINRGLDCDIIVAEVRATSHKPDEIYGIIERLSPGTRKIELFGRAHNVQPNWITLGNQLNGVRLVESNLIEAFEKQNLPYQTSDKI